MLPTTSIVTAMLITATRSGRHSRRREMPAKNSNDAMNKGQKGQGQGGQSGRDQNGQNRQTRDGKH